HRPGIEPARQGNIAEGQAVEGRAAFRRRRLLTQSTEFVGQFQQHRRGQREGGKSWGPAHWGGGDGGGLFGAWFGNSLETLRGMAKGSKRVGNKLRAAGADAPGVLSGLPGAYKKRGSLHVRKAGLRQGCH